MLFILLLFTHWVLQYGSASGGFRKGSEYDALVVSMGGSGCTSMIKRVAESHGSTKYGEPHRLRTNWYNNRDKVKHSLPSFILEHEPHLKYGVVYVFGNMTNSVKSLCRRHFMRIQIQLLGGDAEWADRQKYIPYPDRDASEARPLFRHKPKHEGMEDRNVSNALSPMNAPRVLRVRRILAEAGRRGHDPVGLWNHFSEWRAAAEAGTLPFPVLFVNIASLSRMDSHSSSQLQSFTAATSAPRTGQVYDPKRRKDGDVVRMAVHYASHGEESESVSKGLALYDKHTQDMLGFDGKLFPGRSTE